MRRPLFLQNTAAQEFKPWTAFGIVLIHLLAGLAFLPVFFTWSGFVLFVVMSWVVILGITLGHHRLFTHVSYKAVAALRYTLAVCGCLALEEGPINWGATHRLHHRESDHVDDPHSPLVNFIWSHFLWPMWRHRTLKNAQAVKELVPDLYDDKVLQFLGKYILALWLVFAFGSFGIGYLIGGFKLGMSLMVWGTFVRTVYMWHVTWLVNSATHLVGQRNYKHTDDDSRNLWWVALLTLGEGWHNNHHAIQGSPKFGHRCYEIDIGFIVLSGFKKLGWAYDLNDIPVLLPGEEGPARKGKAPAKSRALPSRIKARRAALTAGSAPVS